MEISKNVKDTLRAFAGQAIVIDAKEVWQRINPGDGLITKLQVLGPAKELEKDEGGWAPPIIDGLNLKVIPAFARGIEFIVELSNTSLTARRIDTGSLAPTLLAKKQGLECFEPSDDLSYAAVTRSQIDLLHSNPVGGSCLINGKGRTVKLSLAPGAAIPTRFNLGAGQRIEVPLRLELSPGEYQFLAGYGGRVHETRPLVSNLVGFDVDETGTPHLIAAAEAGKPARR